MSFFSIKKSFNKLISLGIKLLSLQVLVGFLLVVGFSSAPNDVQAAPYSCDGKTHTGHWGNPPYDGQPLFEFCEENWVVDLSTSDAVAACQTRVQAIKQSDANMPPSLGCGTNSDGAGFFHVFGGVGIDDKTGDPKTLQYAWSLDYTVRGYCVEPFELNPNSTSLADQCMRKCPKDRPFTAKLNDCLPDPNCKCKDGEKGNPINVLTGDKYMIETDYMGGGSFPLEFTRLFDSHNNAANQGRTQWILPRLDDPNNYVITYAPRSSFDNQRRYTPSTSLSSDAFPQLRFFSRPTFYSGRTAEKWRHNYDRFLLASWGYMAINPNDIPPVIRLYRPKGTVEYYTYNTQTGSYDPVNGYSSRISRLPGSHPMAPGWQVVNNSSETEIYTLDGRLLKITALSGLSHTLTYDSATQPKLTRVTDDFGHHIDFTYDAVTGNLTKITDPDGNEYQYTYDASGKISKVIYPDLTPGNNADNPSKTYLYESAAYPDAITGLIDEKGNRYATYGYDNYGRAISTEHAGSVERYSAVIDDANNLRTVTYPLGNQETYHLDAAGRVASIDRLASGSGLVPPASKSSQYDSNGFETRFVDWRGNITTYVRDSLGRELSRTEALGTSAQRTINTTWHTSLNLPTSIVEPGKTTTMTYDSLGHMLTLTETDTTNRSVPYGTNGQTRTTTYTYYPTGVNGANQLNTVNGPRTDVNDITTYEYTDAGFLGKITNPLGQQVQITAYNARGLPLTIIDANGVTTQLAYHPRGWLLTSTVINPSQPGGSQDAVTSYQYDEAGLVTRITMPNGSYLDYGYDTAHRLVSITNNLGERVSYTLDNAGNITSEATATAGSQITRVQTRVFDELNRLYRNIGGANQLSQFAYDANGNLLTSRNDPSGLNQTTSQAFDGLNRLIAVTNAANGVSQYGYDHRNNLTSVTDERGLTTNYIYDAFDDLLLLDSPDTGITVYTYDAAGNVKTEVDARGVAKQYTYDALNRVTLVHFPDDSSEDITYTYDQNAGGYAKGRLTTLQDPTGSTSYLYDHRGNRIAVNSTVQSHTYAMQYSYDLADNLIKTIYPSGRVVENQLDNLGRVSSTATRTNAGASAVPVVGSISYKPFGPATSMQYGNNLTTTLSYDQDYRLTGLQTAGASGTPQVLGRNYVLSAVNNIDDIVDTQDANRSQVFEYDELNRLTGAGGIYGVLHYGYDAVGNRTSEDRTLGASHVVKTYTYFADSNSLQSVSDGTNFRFYQYDAAGNVRSDGSKLYFYNQRNRLIKAAE